MVLDLGLGLGFNKKKNEFGTKMSKFLTIEEAVKEFKIKFDTIEEAIKKNKIPVVYSEGKFNKFSRKHFLKWYGNQEIVKNNPPSISGNLIIVTETKEIKQNKEINVNDFALLKDLAKEYDLHGNCIRGAIRRKEVEYIEENGEFKINKRSFKEWFDKQDYGYDDETAPEVKDLALENGYHPNTVHAAIKNGNLKRYIPTDKDHFDDNNKKLIRVLLKDFDEWNLKEEKEIDYLLNKIAKSREEIKK